MFCLNKLEKIFQMSKNIQNLLNLSKHIIYKIFFKQYKKTNFFFSLEFFLQVPDSFSQLAPAHQLRDVIVALALWRHSHVAVERGDFGGGYAAPPAPAKISSHRSELWRHNAAVVLLVAQLGDPRLRSLPALQLVDFLLQLLDLLFVVFSGLERNLY